MSAPETPRLAAWVAEPPPRPARLSRRIGARLILALSLLLWAAILLVALNL